MKTPTELELSQLMHVYDPAYAREYYLRNRKLTGRKQGTARPASSDNRNGQAPSGNRNGRDPRTGKTREQIAKDARTKQRKELTAQIDRMELNLERIKAKIRELMQDEASKDRKSEAKKERARKEAEKPKTAAEKAKDARESEKYRDKHKQELKTKAKDSKSGGGSSKSDKKKSEAKLSDLKALATKVKGKIAVAKQKLAAL